jgi:hypothetical protein
MYIAYYDETGDDGYPAYSSPIFVLTAVYTHYLDWKQAYEHIRDFRRSLKTDFNFPVKTELHTKYFLLNKKPYRTLSLSAEDRILITDLYCKLAAELDIKIINILINKQKVTVPQYSVLDKALTYSVQRIENDLRRIDPSKRFMIITDPGREGKMRRTTRKIQRINFIPSKFNPESYRQEIKSLIEDPLPKESKESYFIQLADLVSYIVYLYGVKEILGKGFPSRMPAGVDIAKVKNWLHIIKDSLNLQASMNNEYGIVVYPK